MKRYKFEVNILEGSDEFWESLTKGKHGCDEVNEMVEEAVSGAGFILGVNCYVDLISYDSGNDNK